MITPSKDLIDQVEPYTTLTHARMEALYGVAHMVLAERIGGSFVECGTMNGGSAAMLARAIRERDPRQLWLFDSFRGLPRPTKEDREHSEEQASLADALVGTCVGSEAAVREVLGKVGADMSRVHIVPGLFEETLAGAETGAIALLHLDADFYVATRLILETFYDRVSPGGVIVVDDYGLWPGCALAVDDFLEGRSLEPALEESDRCGRWFRKGGPSKASLAGPARAGAPLLAGEATG